MKAWLSGGSARRASASALIIACAAALASFLGSCDVFGRLTSPEFSGSALVRFIEPVDGTIDLRLYASDAGRSAYVVFTTGSKPGAQSPAASQSSARVPAAGKPTAADRHRGVSERASEERRAAFRNLAATYSPSVSPRRSSTGDASSDIVGVTAEFTLYGDAEGSTTATCRYVSGDVMFGERTRSLSIWVPDSEWSNMDGADGKVSPAKVDALAKAFFNVDADTGSSIYSWVTAMLGDEWGPGGTVRYGTSTFDVIGETRNITILLADIDGDGASFIDNGGVVGYFYPGDTIPAFLYSNERVMFTIDSVMLGTRDGSDWGLDDYWPSTVISTLAHEFQHMIHFYQKGVLQGGDYFSEPTWIDELCSMQVEDLLADKMGVPGPRGVDPSDQSAGAAGNMFGRLPEYLLWPDIAPLDWDGASDDELTLYYAWAYSFGAYLTRNYGGSEFVRLVVQSPAADESAVVAAAAEASGRDETLTGLLRRWGAAVLLSARTDAPEKYRYNSGGWFTSTSGEVEYRLGSINMYNYLYANGLDVDGDDTGETDLAEPYVYTSDTIGEAYGGAWSNMFMDLGDPSLRPFWTLEVPSGMYATIVVD